MWISMLYFQLSSWKEMFLNMGLFLYNIKERGQQDFRPGGGDAPS